MKCYEYNQYSVLCQSCDIAVAPKCCKDINKIKIEDKTIENEYCCEEMRNNGWYVERKDNKINLQEEYSAHFIEDIKFCPWCSKKL